MSARDVVAERIWLRWIQAREFETARAVDEREKVSNRERMQLCADEARDLAREMAEGLRAET